MKKIFVEISSGLLEIFTFFPLKIFNKFKQSTLITYVLTEFRNFTKLSTTLIGSIFEFLFLVFLVLIFVINGDSKILISFIFISLVLILFLQIFKKLETLGADRIYFGKKLYSVLLGIINYTKKIFYLEKNIILTENFIFFRINFNLIKIQ